MCMPTYFHGRSNNEKEFTALFDVQSFLILSSYFLHWKCGKKSMKGPNFILVFVCSIKWFLKSSTHSLFPRYLGDYITHRIASDSLTINWITNIVNLAVIADLIYTNTPIFHDLYFSVAHGVIPCYIGDHIANRIALTYLPINWIANIIC